MTIVAIVSLLLLGGILGGYAGYLQGPPSPDDLSPERRKSLRFRSIVLGIVGAFLVPVFLTVVRATSGSEKDLLDQLSGNPATISGWFVLFGFSLLAAVSSQRLISSLTKKLFDDVLARAESAEKIASEAREDVDELEDELGEVAVNKYTHESNSIMSKPLNELSIKVLEAIYCTPERRPSKAQIANTAQLRKEEVSQALNDLESRGLVRSKVYDGKKGWRVRTTGKAFLAARQLPKAEASTKKHEG